MQTKSSDVGERAFGATSEALGTGTCKSHSDISKMLRDVTEEGRTFALLYGSKYSGMSAIIKQFRQSLAKDSCLIAIDGASLTALQIVSKILRDLGCNVELQTVPEFLDLIRLIAVHKMRSSSAPIILVENIDRMTPSALQVLCTMAEFESRGQTSVQLVLTGGDQSPAILASRKMLSVRSRTSCLIQIGPMTNHESINYLYSRLSASGIMHPDSIFPLDVCDHLHKLSGGMPRLLRRVAMQAINRAVRFPVRISDTYAPPASAGRLGAEDNRASVVSPRLLVSRRGKLFREHVIDEKKILVGRSALADVRLDDDYISTVHAVLLFRSSQLIIADLNSSNGVFVNSRKIRSVILREADIVSIGQYTMKVENLPASHASATAANELNDTAKMKTLADKRSQRLANSAVSDNRNKQKA